METSHREAFDMFKQAMLKKRIPRNTVKSYMWVITKDMNLKENYIQDTHNTKINEAISEQLEVGVGFVLQGILYKGWCWAIESTNLQNPERKAQALLELTWIEVMEPILR